MRNKSHAVMLGTMALVVLVLCGHALAADYYSISNPGTTAPPNSPWVAAPAPPNTITWAGGTTIWFATSNFHDSLMKKSWTVTLAGNTTLLSSWNAFGYYDGGSSQSSVGSTSDQHGAGRLTCCRTFDPQPSWEVIQITSSLATGNHTCTLQTSTSCQSTLGTLGPRLNWDGWYGPPGDVFAYTEIWVMPADFAVNTAETPTLAAPPETGNWSYQFVSTDPYGTPAPHGGVRWTSDGPGLEAEDSHQLELSLLGPAKSTYWCYPYNAMTGEYELLWWDARFALIPTVSEWGLIVIAILILTAGAILIRRRRLRGC